MSVSIGKLDGVESVDLSLNRGHALIQLRPGNSVTLGKIHERVRRNGFTPQEATVIARAQVLVSGAQLQLKVLGANDTYQVATDAASVLNELRQLAGRDVVAEGVVTVSKGRGPAVMHVKRVQPAGN